MLKLRFTWHVAFFLHFSDRLKMVLPCQIWKSSGAICMNAGFPEATSDHKPLFSHYMPTDSSCLFTFISPFHVVCWPAVSWRIDIHVSSLQIEWSSFIFRAFNTSFATHNLAEATTWSHLLLVSDFWLAVQRQYVICYIRCCCIFLVIIKRTIYLSNNINVFFVFGV